MKTPSYFLAAIVLTGTVAATTLLFRDLLANGATDDHPASSSTDGSSGVRDLALTLSSGGEAMRSLRGSATNHDDKDTVNISIPNMDCSIDRRCPRQRSRR
jgi:hypothetical protein